MPLFQVYTILYKPQTKQHRQRRSIFAAKMRHRSPRFTVSLQKRFLFLETNKQHRFCSHRIRFDQFLVHVFDAKNVISVRKNTPPHNLPATICICYFDRWNQRSYTGFFARITILSEPTWGKSCIRSN